MNKIINAEEAAKISKKIERREKQLFSRVDVLTFFHLVTSDFWKPPENKEMPLFVFVESGSKVRKIKKENRPD